MILLLTMVVSLSSCKKSDEGGGESDNSPITFADVNFRAALIAQGVDTNNDGEISYAEAKAVTTLDLEGRGDITSLEGIAYFTKLKELYCISTGLLSLDVSSNSSLAELDCEDCESLTYIIYNSAKQSPSSWYYEQITQLVDVNPATIVSFVDADFGEAVASIIGKEVVTMSDVLKITSLDVSNNSDFDSIDDIIYFRSLKHLACRSTRITSLDVSSLPQLESLDCGESLLATLDVSRNVALESLICDYTNLATLDVSSCTALNSLTCTDCASLTTIYIYSGQSIATLNSDDGVALSEKRQ